MRLGRLAALRIAIVLLGVVATFASSVVLATEDACASGGAVPDPDNNPGLVSDCAALLAARDTLAGTATLDWAAETPVTQWEGVTVEGTPLRVTRLILQGRQLTGEIPTELGNLSNLTWLYLSGNQFTGCIPGELLRFLDTTANDLNDLGLVFDCGVLLAARDTLAGSATLNWEADTPVAQWEGVTVRGNPQRVARLDLRGMGLDGTIPGELGLLSKLTLLNLRTNQLSGTIPAELGRLTRLRRLWIHSSGLTGSIPPELGNMTGLWGLNLRDNDLTGSIPTALGDLSNMRKLRLHNNDLTGSIPTELGNLSNLTDLWLSGNGLSGPIPAELGMLDKLKRLSLRNNELSGDIPAALGNLADTLTQLFLAGNSGLTGCVPPGLADVARNDIADLGLDVCEPSAAEDRAVLRDVFGRVVNETGIVLVDWEGHIANPAMKYSVELPGGAATLSSSEPRLYFDLPSSTGANGPTKTLVSEDPTQATEFHISIFPDRDSSDESHTLTIQYTDDQSQVRSQTIDVHVIDQDMDRTFDFNVTTDFSQEQTGLFDDSNAKGSFERAAKDWAYYIGDMNLDEVPAGREVSWIWDSRGYSYGGKSIRNKESYTGFLLYGYGIEDRTGGQPSNGSYQTTNSKPHPLRRSGNISINKDGNFNTLGWNASLPDEEWWKATNLHNVQNDLYSIALHEIGHALVFNPAYDEFAKFKEKGYIDDPTVEDYYGVSPRISPGLPDHLPETIDPASKRGAYGNEYGGEMPLGRWLLTKGHLLIAQAIGYDLRNTSPFVPLSLHNECLPEATVGTAYTHEMRIEGGTPVYHWTIESGALPEGLFLDSFTGTISGTPVEAGTFRFVVRVRDSIEGSPGATRAVTLNVRS